MSRQHELQAADHSKEKGSSAKQRPCASYGYGSGRLDTNHQEAEPPKPDNDLPIQGFADSTLEQVQEPLGAGVYSGEKKLLINR